MKLNLLKSSVLAIFSILSIACSKDETKETISTSTETSITISNAGKVNITAIDANGVGKPNYIVAIFNQPVSLTAELPPILIEKTTDSNGFAAFDLNTIVTNTVEKPYYFEVFVRQSNGNLIFKSIARRSENLKKGDAFTTAIIVR